MATLFACLRANFLFRLIGLEPLLEEGMAGHKDSHCIVTLPVEQLESDAKQMITNHSGTVPKKAQSNRVLNLHVGSRRAHNATQIGLAHQSRCNRVGEDKNVAGALHSSQQRRQIEFISQCANRCHIEMPTRRKCNEVVRDAFGAAKAAIDAIEGPAVLDRIRRPAALIKMLHDTGQALE